MSAGGSGFHPKAWLAWLVAASAAAYGSSNPFAHAAMLGGVGVVAAAFARPGPEGRAFRLMMRLGVTFLVLRTALFALTGHTGQTVLFSTPVASLPPWLGGLEIGGEVTGEVIAQSSAEGLRLLAMLACFGAFVSATDVYRLLRLVPRFLAEAGLIVAIALAFVPSILRAASDVREAQRLRGHRTRGVRGTLPIVVPVLAGALERSVTLAESMETRGYGRLAPGAHRTEARARAVVLLAVLGLIGGGAATLYGRGPAGVAPAVVVASLVAGGAALRAIGAMVGRTRLRPEPVSRWDLALLATSAATAVCALLVARAGAGSWYAYPRLQWPALDWRAVAVGVALAAPVGLEALRAWLAARDAGERPVEGEATHARALAEASR